MEGFGVHTFKLVNKEGRETYCKFHWKPKCGERLARLQVLSMMGFMHGRPCTCKLHGRSDSMS